MSEVKCGITGVMMGLNALVCGGAVCRIAEGDAVSGFEQPRLAEMEKGNSGVMRLWRVYLLYAVPYAQ